MALGTFKLFNSFAATAMAKNWVNPNFFTNNFVDIFLGVLITNFVKPSVEDTSWKYRGIPAISQYPYAKIGHLSVATDEDTGATTMYSADSFTWPIPRGGTSEVTAAQQVAYCVVLRGSGGTINNFPRIGFIDLTSDNGVTPRDISLTGMTISFSQSRLFSCEINR